MHGVGFAPALQSSYTQGLYPLALGFKPPPDESTMLLLAPTVEFIPPATLLGAPAPIFGQTKENKTEERPGRIVVDDREETPPTHAQGGRTKDRFGRSEQNNKLETSEASLSGLPLRLGHLYLDWPNSIVPAPVGMENIEFDRGEIPRQGCSEVVPSLRTPSPPDDDDDSASMFTTIQSIGGSTGISASIPSCGTGDIGE